MKKEQKQLIIIIVLFFFVALVWIRIIFKKAPEEFAPIPPGSVEKPIEAGFSIGRVDFFELEEKLKKNRPQLEWVRDPFQFPPKKYIKKTDFEGLNLTGIIYDEESPVAVINDVIVKKGDVVEGVTVLEIRRESVVLEKEDKSYTLELLKWEE